MKPTRCRHAALLPFLLAACGGARAPNLARAVIDTLPGNIPRVTSAGPTAWTDSAGARLVEEARFSGEDGAASEISEARSIGVDDHGRAYVVDTKPALIKVYSPDGKLVRTIGREGDGPGEFRAGFIAVRSGFVVLHDPQVARTSVWDTAGTYVRSWHDSCCFYADIQIDKQNRIYVPSMVAPKPDEKPRGWPYVRWTLEGIPIDTLFVPQKNSDKFWTISAKRGGQLMSQMSTSIPFMPSISSALHPEGGVVYGWNGAYSIVRSTNGADSVRVFGKSWSPDPVSDELRRGQVESAVNSVKEQYGEPAARAAFKASDLPSTLPAFENLRVDETGRIWVRRYTVSDTTRTFYDVFDSTGAYLGPVVAPVIVATYGAQAWTRDGLVTVIEGSDGRPAVVRLRFQLGKPK